MIKKSNISIFIPHLGCPHKCSFCDQNAITSVNAPPTPAQVETIVKDALLSGNCDKSNTEIAFFGGSFTAIQREYMIALLEMAQKLIDEYNLLGIRISTRPDCIDEEILNILKKYGVTAIELGAQSTNDEVLKLNRRGHTFADIVTACNLIRQKGFLLGLQMMTGLYGSSNEIDRKTAEDIAGLYPDTVRVYPAITLENTLLAKLYREGAYIPPTLNETVELCAFLLKYFSNQNIRVIKLGLHASKDVEDNYVAGPYHPSFRELCESKIYFERAKVLLQKCEKNSKVILCVNDKAVSKMIGNQKSNIKSFSEMGYNCFVTGNPNIPMFDVKIIMGED